MLAAPLPARAVVKAEEARAAGPLPPRGDLDKAPGAWLWPDPAPVVVTFWGVSQRTED